MTQVKDLTAFGAQNRRSLITCVRTFFMNSREKLAAVETILTRVAEELGDITEPVISTYYQRLPRARELFEMHALGNRRGLEGEMVERSLYCLMTWFESPGEIEIVLLGSVPHHSDTLKVPPEFYQQLLAATADVVEKTIPAENSQELAVWRELRSELDAIINQSANYVQAG